jgi:hypothetical protein
VYFEHFSDIDQAIAREKEIKSMTRRQKIKLIESMNPDWRDLSQESHNCHDWTLAPTVNGALHRCHSRAWLPREESRILGLLRPLTRGRLGGSCLGSFQ